MPNTLGRQGEQLDTEFFQTLYRDPEFCSQLGQMTLAAGRFESNLRAYLGLRGVNVSERQATLNSLTKQLVANGYISESGARTLRMLKTQRNYLTHSLFDLFANRAEQSLLPRTDLLPADVSLFIGAAWQLEQNFMGLNGIAEERIQALIDMEPAARQQDGLLFTP